MSENTEKHHLGKVEHFFRRVLHILELVISGLCILVLIGALVMEGFRLVTIPGYVTDLHQFLQNVLSIVVGLEFVRMLIDLTPANTLEVLIMATARYIIMNHEEPLTLLVGVACMAGLFAIRRFLVRRSEMSQELVEID